MLACHSIRFFHLLSSTQQPSSPPLSPSPPTSFFSHSPVQELRQLSPAFISTTIATTSTKTLESSRPSSPTSSIFSLADIDMPATPKAAFVGNGQKIATATPAASPAGSVARPSPSSAGMSTPTEVPSTPLSKNQKKKRSKAAKTAASAATSPAAPFVATTDSSPSTPVANVKQQQETSTSTKQQITPTVELLGLSEEKKTLAEGASPIARNILDTASTPAALPQTPKRAFVAHTFRWKNGGGAVKVTGTFDNWGESIVLKKVGGNQDQFEVVIDLDRSQKTLFKFIVDGQWKCTDEFPTEYDSIGNLNNVLPALNA